MSNLGSRPAVIAAVAAALLMPGASASAQGLFDLFNGDRYAPRQGNYAPRPAFPPQTNAYSDPFAPAPATPSYSGGTGRVLSYCVRLCDGRYFPMQRHANANPVQLCSSFCPAAKTAVFNGSQIDYASASNGARYADIDNAFVYREKIVPGCTCNGKDSFGLARIDVNADPTLRQGDIVASGDNVKAALIAMQASKERVRDAANEPPALRGTVSRRTVVGPVPPNAAKTGAAQDIEQGDAIPED